jgi:hypothetical protein
MVNGLLNETYIELKAATILFVEKVADKRKRGR